MPKKLTITVDADVYDGLHSVVGRRRISRFLNDLARPHVIGQDLAAGDTATAADEARESEARAWSNSLIADVAEEPARRGDVWLVSFDMAVGGEIQKTRPAVVLSNDTANSMLNRVQVVPISSQVERLYPAETYLLLNRQRRKAMADQTPRQASIASSGAYASSARMI